MLLMTILHSYVTEVIHNMDVKKEKMRTISRPRDLEVPATVPPCIKTVRYPYSISRYSIDETLYVEGFKIISKEPAGCLMPLVMWLCIIKMSVNVVVLGIYRETEKAAFPDATIT